MLSATQTTSPVPARAASARPVIATASTTADLRVRVNDGPPVGDASLDDAHDNAGITADFLRLVLGRDSIDDAGAKIRSFVHVSSVPYAQWSSGRMLYGDGDATFRPCSGAVDIVAHELTHGVTEQTTNFQYAGQSGALDESMCDLFGEAVEQWHESPTTFTTPEGARSADWLIGEDAVRDPALVAIRDMRDPANERVYARQPARMRDFVVTSEDHGGVHLNSGIPNKAAYEAAQRIGTEKVVKIWYDALPKLGTTPTFEDAASAIVASADALYHDAGVSTAVRDAWRSVGLLRSGAGQPAR